MRRSTRRAGSRDRQPVHTYRASTGRGDADGGSCRLGRIRSDRHSVFRQRIVFEFKNWIDLAAYKFDSRLKTILVNNVNYDRSIPLINTLTYSHWGVLSFARSSIEYAVICNELEPIILTQNELIDELEKGMKKMVFSTCNLISDDNKIKANILKF